LSHPLRERARAEVRASVGVADDAVALLYCGRLIGRKGVDTLLRAVARVRHATDRRTEHVRVLLAGDGPDRSALEALASDAGVRDSVHFLGFRQPADLPDVFAAADAFVLPSHAEGWGVVVTEAMAAGLPVLASDSVNAAADLVRDGENGWRFPARADARLAELIHDVAADPCRRASMGARSRAAIRCETPAIAAPRFVQILEAAAEGRPLQPL
nr:glycosyltransferase [Candidatus Eremiobacteraeota bacterium]